MADGDLIELEITDVAHGGVFVGRHEGRVVFVPDVLPGERVRVRVTDAGKPAFWRAEALEVLDASPHRRPHVWRQADIDVPPDRRPGGADFGHIDLAHQRRLKHDVVTSALRRFAGLELPVAVGPVTPLRAPDGTTIAAETEDGTRWRTRVSLHVDADGRIGPFGARSHRVIAVEDLPLAVAEVEYAARELTGLAPGRVDLVQPADGRVRVIPRPERVGRRTRERGGSRHTARRTTRPGTAPPGAANAGREVVVERALGREFRVDAGGFWQVHRLAAHTLSDLVTRLLRETRSGGIDPDAWHLDLYGGVGLFAATLAALSGPATHVTSVESDPRATGHAAANLAEWAGARAETSRVDRWIERLDAEASASERARLSRGVVLLDPPRAGAGRAVVEGIARLQPDTVVYVACDPVALARDVATFHTAGYETQRVEAVDLFPNSHHVEAVTILTRASRVAKVAA